jgi:hypothetical protein
MRHRKPRYGDGTAWLVADRVRGDYLCYWYVGPNGTRLAERARVGSSADAVAWGRLRTSRVRIRTPEARTYWAGSAPRPDGFSETWAEPTAADVPSGVAADFLEQHARVVAAQTTDTTPSKQLTGTVRREGSSC